MIYAKTARQLLYSWHGGQWSPFYAAASSGLVADWITLLEECGRIDDADDRIKLREYLKSWQYRAPRVRIGSAEYACLPWSAR
jgi:hypothetical protein